MLAGGHVGCRCAQPSPEWPVNKNTVQRTLCRPQVEYCLCVQIHVRRLWTSGQTLTAPKRKFGFHYTGENLDKFSVRWRGLEKYSLNWERTFIECVSNIGRTRRAAT